jgi:hypothetical protein
MKIVNTPLMLPRLLCSEAQQVQLLNIKESRDNKLIKFSFAMEGVRNSSRREIGPA